MNREQTKALLPVITAFAEGKTIQFRTALNADWINWDHDLCPEFDRDWQWRVKPEPREFWLVFEQSQLPEVWTYPPPEKPNQTVIHVREIT